MSFNLRTLTHTVSEISCCFIRCPTGKVAGSGATSCLSGNVTDVHWRLGGTLSGGCSATCFESGRLCDPVGMEQANTAAWAKLACQDPNLGIVCNNNWYPSTDPNTVIPCTGPDYVAANGGTYSYTANGCSFAPYVFLSLLLAVQKCNVSLALTPPLLALLARRYYTKREECSSYSGDVIAHQVGSSAASCAAQVPRTGGYYPPEQIRICPCNHCGMGKFQSSTTVKTSTTATGCLNCDGSSSEAGWSACCKWIELGWKPTNSS